LIWAVLALLALALFLGMSLLALVNRSPSLPLGSPTPTHTLTPAGDEPATDVAASGEERTPAPPLPEATAGPADAPADESAAIGLWLSAVSAITALIGLASSLWLGWRKEGREVVQHKLELERARLEIRKLRQEVGAAGGMDPAQRDQEQSS
jgi:hypothetical protein